MSLSRNSAASLPPMAVCESRWPRVMAPRLSRRRAMVAMKRRSPFTSVVTGRNSGAEAWCVRWVLSEALDRLVGAPAGLQQVVDAPLGVPAGKIGVVAAPGAAGHGEHQDALLAVHERGGLGEVGGGRPAAQREAFALCIGDPQDTRLDRPVTSATASCPKCCTIWSSAVGTGGNEASFSISASRRSSASLHMTGLPSGSLAGRLRRLPPSSVKGSCNCTGKACIR